MNFDHSDDQKFLKDEARKFLDAHCTIPRVRAVLDDPAKSYDEALWHSVAEQGWLGAAGRLRRSGIECDAARADIGKLDALAP